MPQNLGNYRLNDILEQGLRAHVNDNSNEGKWRRALSDQGEIKKAKPSVGEKIEGKLSDLLQSAGMDHHSANRRASRAMAAINDLTPVGNVTGADEGQRMFRAGVTQGDVGTATLGAAVFALSALPFAKGQQTVKRKLSELLMDESGAIRAWHGSPHDFDKFSLSKIGTGEGAQAYGHGLYFAENPAVATEYQKALTSRDNPKLQHAAAKALGVDAGMGPDLVLASALPEAKDAGDFRARIAEHVARGLKKPADTFANWEAQQIDKALKTGRVDRYFADNFDVARGRLYEVNINAEPEDFLDWDAPLSRQPQHVQSAVEPLIEKRYGGPASNYRLGTLGRDPDGNKLFRELTTGGGVLEQHLRQQGLPGLRYLDQGSRSAADGTRNYVVFDDALIDILNKF